MTENTDNADTINNAENTVITAHCHAAGCLRWERILVTHWANVAPLDRWYCERHRPIPEHYPEEAA